MTLPVRICLLALGAIVLAVCQDVPNALLPEVRTSSILTAATVKTLTPTDLGTLGGPYGYAHDINNRI